MPLFQLPSFAFLTSLLLILPPSGCGDWLVAGNVAADSVPGTCCGSMPEVVRLQPASSEAACPPLQSVCDCCDAAEGTVPARATPPAPAVGLVVQIDDSSVAEPMAVRLLTFGSVCPRLRLHILKCVWRC